MPASTSRRRGLADRPPEEHQQIRRFLADALEVDQADLHAAIHRRAAEFSDDDPR